MPGFKFDDDELSQLFAQAGDAVKKAARSAPSASREAEPAPSAAAPAAPVPDPVVDERPGPAPVLPPATEPPAAPAPSPAPASAGSPIRLVGGEQDATALVGRCADGSTVRVPWADMKTLSVARVGERTHLGFVYRQTVYYFSEENVAYKGLLKTLGATLNLNWRALVNEMSGQVTDRSDVGLQAMTGGGGMVPRVLTLADFAKALLSRA